MLLETFKHDQKKGCCCCLATDKSCHEPKTRFESSISSIFIVGLDKLYYILVLLPEIVRMRSSCPRQPLPLCTWAALAENSNYLANMSISSACPPLYHGSHINAICPAELASFASTLIFLTQS
ncbi:hypothetical protein BC830DRAFT_543139 [Chytriomyces sp. MP71]|nr:hypothetical protein BC830DRAFT_543139 [Chytriomyces sp. MP71]